MKICRGTWFDAQTLTPLVPQKAIPIELQHLKRFGERKDTMKTARKSMFGKIGTAIKPAGWFSSLSLIDSFTWHFRARGAGPDGRRDGSLEIEGRRATLQKPRLPFATRSFLHLQEALPQAQERVLEAGNLL